eukprot:1116476-Lingulodinium_polyedra.AAC.1
MDECQWGAVWPTVDAHGRRKADARDPLQATSARVEEFMNVGEFSRAAAAVWGSAFARFAEALV